MALVNETGTGLANANSFVSVAEADTFLADRGYTAWAALTTQAKEYALIAATDYLNAAYSWVSIRLTTTQALSWPRFPTTGMVPSGVPPQIKQAIIRIAMMAGTQSVDLFASVTGDSLIRRAQAGSVSVEFSDMALSVKAAGKPLMPWLNDLLAGLYLSAPDDASNGNGYGYMPVVRG